MSGGGPGHQAGARIHNNNDPPSLPPKTRGTPRLPPKPLDPGPNIRPSMRPAQHSQKRPLPPLPPPRVPPPPPPMPR